MFAGISADGIGTPAYAGLLRERLRADVQAGARGLGELTDKGLGLVRVGDKAYYIDDPVFDPLWEEAATAARAGVRAHRRAGRVLPAAR